MSELFVFLNGRRAGTLDTSDRRALRFAYTAEYTVDPTSTPLSVSMPLRHSPYTNTTVHPFLWGLLPDDPRVIERWAREFGCSASDIGGLLHGVGTDVAGAATFVTGEAPPRTGPSGDVRWLDDEDIADVLRALRQDTATWRSDSLGRWSLAGAQAKVALHRDPSTERWGIPSGAVPTTHIMKPAVGGLEDFDINEHLCLSAADRLGIRAAGTEIRTFAGERTLVVRRYDRIANGALVRRIQQEDLCQALAIHPDRKYEVDGGPGADQLGRLIRDVCGGVDVQRFFEALAFSWLVLATDGHAKNFSFLLDGPHVRFAPLYDVASALPHVAYPRRAKLAQRVGGESRAAFIKRRHWERLARRLGLDADEALAQIASLVARLPDAFADATHAATLDEHEGRFADRLRDQIGAWANERARDLE